MPLDEEVIPFIREGEELPKPAVEVGEIQKLMDQVAMHEDLADKIEQDLEEQKNILKEFKFRLLKTLSTCGLRTFTHDGKTAVIAKSVSIKAPQGDEKLAFFDELKRLGKFDDLISINSKTLNAWYKSEFGVTIDDQGEIVFEKVQGVPQVPGLEFPTIIEQLRINKKRGKK